MLTPHHCTPAAMRHAHAGLHQAVPCSALQLGSWLGCPRAIGQLLLLAVLDCLVLQGVKGTSRSNRCSCVIVSFTFFLGLALARQQTSSERYLLQASAAQSALRGSGSAGTLGWLSSLSQSEVAVLLLPCPWRCCARGIHCCCALLGCCCFGLLMTSLRWLAAIDEV